MRIKPLTLLLFPLVLIASNSCTYHNEDDYFKDNPSICYTENLSFETDITPLFQANCVSCHNTGNQQGGVNLDNYTGITQQAKNGKLVSVIKHETGFSPMPAYQPKLDDCTISKIEAWVNNGSKNN